MAVRKKALTRKASGSNIEEWQRKTMKVQLRVGATIATAISDRAEECALNKSQYVSQLVLADLARATQRHSEEKK